MDRVEIDIPFEYDAVGVRRRSRNPQRLRIRSVARASIPFLRSKDIGRAVLSSRRERGDRLHDAPYPLLDGRPLARVRPRGVDGVRIDAYAELVEECLTSDKVFDAHPSPFAIPTLDRRGREHVDDRTRTAEADVARLDGDDRAARAALAAVDAANLAFVDGLLHSCRHEPCLVLDPYGRYGPEGGTAQPSDRGIRIRDAVDEAADVLEPLRTHGHYERVSLGSLDELRGLLPEDPCVARTRFSGDPVAYRHPSFQAFLVRSARAAALEHYPNHGGVALLGLGDMGVVDVPGYLDEAAFGLRTLLRGVEGDGRRGPPLGPDGEAPLIEAMERLEDATRRAAAEPYSRSNAPLAGRDCARRLDLARRWHARRVEAGLSPGADASPRPGSR